MTERSIKGPEHLSASALHALRHALEEELGADKAARAMNRIGHGAGDALVAALSKEIGTDDLATLDEAEFWHRLGVLFRSRGWGHILFEATHSGIGALESADWAEADPNAAALRPSCHFTVGLLANLLGRVADDEVGVLETACRSRGDLHCRFLFGGRGALDSIYAGMRIGVAVDDLIADLA
jgi:predicted hydrocarbon binding protein